MEVQLLDPEYLTRSIGFINLVMAWLVRMADPTQKHPATKIGFVLISLDLDLSLIQNR